MESTNKTYQKEPTPLQAIAYCQQKLGSIPYTISQHSTIGQPLSEVVVILKKVAEQVVALAQENVRLNEELGKKTDQNGRNAEDVNDGSVPNE